MIKFCRYRYNGDHGTPWVQGEGNMNVLRPDAKPFVPTATAFVPTKVPMKQLSAPLRPYMPPADIWPTDRQSVSQWHRSSSLHGELTDDGHIFTKTVEEKIDDRVLSEMRNFRKNLVYRPYKIEIRWQNSNFFEFFELGSTSQKARFAIVVFVYVVEEKIGEQNFRVLI